MKQSEARTIAESLDAIVANLKGLSTDLWRQAAPDPRFPRRAIERIANETATRWSRRVLDRDEASPVIENIVAAVLENADHAETIDEIADLAARYLDFAPKDHQTSLRDAFVESVRTGDDA